MIQIITDSMSDIKQEEARLYAIEVLPLHVLFGDESFLDGVDLNAAQFYKKMASTKDFPKTSQIPPEVFSSAFAAALEKGNEIVCILGSSKLSGTYQSAVLARDMQESGAPIFLVDSLTASLGEQLLVREAIRLRDEGETAAGIAETISELVRRSSMFGYVDDVKHLVRGGRLPAAAGHISSTLNLKPLLAVSDGSINRAGVSRGKKHCFAWLKKQLDEHPRDKQHPICLASANNPSDLEELRQYLEGAGVDLGTVYLVEIGAVIGTHTGEGILALSWIHEA